jgi:hypothetical protein
MPYFSSLFSIPWRNHNKRTHYTQKEKRKKGIIEDKLKIVTTPWTTSAEVQNSYIFHIFIPQPFLASFYNRPFALLIGQKFKSRFVQTQLNSKIFRRCCIILCGVGFMDFIHRSKSKILKLKIKKIKITTFRKLDLLPSSSEWRWRREEHLLNWAP